MKLQQIQREMFEVVRTPLTPTERSRRLTVDGRNTREVAKAIIRPNDRLTSMERLEIYNRQYWFRLISALMEDFEGLRTIVGERRFEKLAVQYLTDCPSRSFTLRNLGSRLPQWLEEHPEFAGRQFKPALEMARLEWAEIVAFDGPVETPLTPASMASLGADPVLRLQPNIQVLQFEYEADEFLLKIRRKQEQNSSSANSASMKIHRGREAKIPRVPSRGKEPVFLAVHRQDDSVYFKRLDARQYQFLTAISGRRGKRLSRAIDTVNWQGIDGAQVVEEVKAWFALWASLNWLTT